MTPIRLQDCPGTTLVSDLSDMLKSLGLLLEDVSWESRPVREVHEWLGDRIHVGERDTLWRLTARAVCPRGPGLAVNELGARSHNSQTWNLGGYKCMPVKFDTIVREDGCQEVEIEFQVSGSHSWSGSGALSGPPLPPELMAKQSDELRRVARESDRKIREADERKAIAACVKGLMMPPTPEERREIERQMEEDT